MNAKDPCGHAIGLEDGPACAALNAWSAEEVVAPAQESQRFDKQSAAEADSEHSQGKGRFLSMEEIVPQSKQALH